jgi:hypothetical protein
MGVKEVGSLLGQHKVPGASLAIIQNGEIVATEGILVKAPGDIPPCIRQRPFGIAADRQRLPSSSGHHTAG